MIGFGPAHIPVILSLHWPRGYR